MPGKKGDSNNQTFREASQVNATLDYRNCRIKKLGKDMFPKGSYGKRKIGPSDQRESYVVLIARTRPSIQISFRQPKVLLAQEG